MSVELGNQLLPHFPLFNRVILKYLQGNLFLSLKVMVDYWQQYAKVYTSIILGPCGDICR